MALSDKCLGNSLALRIKFSQMNKMNSQAKYLAYHTRVILRLVNTTNARANHSSKITEPFEKGSDNYKSFNRKEIAPLELSWPKSWVLTEPAESSRQIGSFQITQRGKAIILNLEEPMRGRRISKSTLRRSSSSRTMSSANPLDQFPRRSISSVINERI